MSIPALKSPFHSPLPAAAALIDPASPPFASLAARANLGGIDSNTTPCSSLALPFKGSIACGSLTSRGHWKSSLSHKRADRCVQASAEADNMAGSRDPEEGPVQATVEQGKRILALQKELLDQIAERKKLVTSLKENLGSPVEQMNAYNDGDDKTRKEATDQANDSLGQSLINHRISSKPPSSTVTRATDFRAPSGGLSQADIGKAQRSQNYERTGLPAYSRTRSSDFLPSTPTIPTTTPTSPTPTTPIPTSPSPSSPLPETLSLEDIIKSGVDKKSLLQESLSEDLSEKGEVGAASGTSAEKPPPPAGPNVMNVIVVAAECAPWSKTGGLGDVAGALPKALARRGHRVMVVAPRYGIYEEAWETGVRKRYNVAGQDLEVAYYHAYIDGVDHVFIDNSVFHGFANNIYGGNRQDVLKRMVLFCKAAVEVPWHVPCGGVCYGDGNLVFIANDWHTALLPVYLQAYYRDHGLMQYTRSVLVIHNMAHQGRGPLSDYSLLALPDHYIEKFRLYDPIGGEHMNIFMAGLITAHRIVAVSHGYAWECQTQEGGWGLDGVIREHKWKLRGIVNGIDDKEWSPELDVHLKGDGYVNYSLNSLESGKPICKSALQKELSLPVRSDVPMVGFIGRLDHQKGVDIIADAMPWMMEQDLQLVMLGSGRDDLENMLRSFEGRHRDKVRGWVGFSVKTAHRITAGCDILLMPSRFEPCGLNQLYAMRYGTIPVVHAVGGLRDTVQAFDPYSNTGTGWTFDRADPSAMIHALGNALWTYRDFKDSWRGIQQRGMSQDLSWDNAAKQYEEVMLAAKYQW